MEYELSSCMAESPRGAWSADSTWIRAYRDGTGTVLPLSHPSEVLILPGPPGWPHKTLDGSRSMLHNLVYRHSALRALVAKWGLPIGCWCTVAPGAHATWTLPASSYHQLTRVHRCSVLSRVMLVRFALQTDLAGLVSPQLLPMGYPR